MPNKSFQIYFKSILVGFGAMIPGLSGGTMAMATGIFEEILENISSILHHPKQNI